MTNIEVALVFTRHAKEATMRPRISRYRPTDSLLAVVGATLIVLALAGCRRDLATLQTPQVSAKDCAKLWAKGDVRLTGKDVILANGTLQAHRIKNLGRDPDAFGKWVGGLSNPGPAAVDPFPYLEDPDHVLQTGEKGCLFMVIADAQHSMKLSTVFIKTNGKTTHAVGGQFCPHKKHSDDSEPDVKDPAEKCQDRLLSGFATPTGSVTISVVGGDISKVPRAGGAKGPVPLAAPEEVFIKGTWFPCSSNGCCRAF